MAEHHTLGLDQRGAVVHRGAAEPALHLGLRLGQLGPGIDAAQLGLRRLHGGHAHALRGGQRHHVGQVVLALPVVVLHGPQPAEQVGCGRADHAGIAQADPPLRLARVGELHDARDRAGRIRHDAPVFRLLDIAGQLLAAPFPRHLSQHVGGFVLTEDRLDETVPLHNAAMEGRTFIEWDKDDVDELGLMKVDVLALGMLTCIRKAFALLREHGLGEHDLEVDLKADDPAVYAMLEKADSIGVFQVESRAQMNMLPRLKPRNLYDLTVQVAIVRPGPIEGDMVHPYLRRRCGEEAAEFPSPAPPHDPDELRNLLGRTFGVPIFQEQAMKLAIVAAGFTPSEANALRRAMATFRNVGTIGLLRDKMIRGMTRRGYTAEFAERCFRQIEGFGSYGFPESHALSFARLVYVSAWIKCHHPAAFACALLNAQPMGFYAPAQIVRDAREHGVAVRPVDVNHSAWDSTLERDDAGALALRLGFRQVEGFREAWAAALVGIGVSIRLRRGRQRPLFEGLDATEPLALAQRSGLAVEQLVDLLDHYGHA
ncbi:hypothetical protein J4558_26140 [Leptolyngbya sp. 15MV]|nr:hypothetical protein J4558_26140 [Leptolyngbya sp. 15MV]